MSVFFPLPWCFPFGFCGVPTKGPIQHRSNSSKQPPQHPILDASRLEVSSDGHPLTASKTADCSMGLLESVPAILPLPPLPGLSLPCSTLPLLRAHLLPSMPLCTFFLPAAEAPVAALTGWCRPPHSAAYSLGVISVPYSMLRHLLPVLQVAVLATGQHRMGLPDRVHSPT